jgi:uncharacterized repeat protein (TIGR01451 family)
MTHRRWITGAVALAALVGSTADAQATPRLRRQFNLHGDFVLVGNTLGQECRTGGQAAPAPVVGTVGNCGLNVSDSAYDVYWRSEQPGAGQALADNTITLADARSSAVLGVGTKTGSQLPAGATIVHAQLYWAATLLAGLPKRTVTLERPGGGSVTVSAQDSLTVPAGGNVYYQNTADVTSTVRQFGPGVYRVSGFDSQPVVDQSIDDTFAAWTLVVVYDRPADPVRNVTLFDGLEFVDIGGQTTVNLTGFLVPTAGFDAKLGVVAYEGDDGGTGDSLAFKAKSAVAATLLGDALNPTANFFNGTRSVFGQPVSLVGDLPQQTGRARSMSGYDLDIVDITSLVAAGDDSATITASSTSDKYAVGAMVTSISTLAPDFTTSTKTVRNLTARPGGATFTGDVVEFTLDVTNTGNDDATEIVLADTIPAGFTYVADSTTVVTGANSGNKTDRKDLDTVDYDVASRTLTVRLGTGADGTRGGRMAVSEATQLRFRATVDAGTAGQFLTNQASVSAQGFHGSPRTTWATDSGDGGFPEPTKLPVDACAVDSECPGTRCSRVHPYVCEVCNGDFASGATQACIDGTRPACNTAGTKVGACTECTQVNVSRCSTPTAPTCNTQTGVCAGCLVDYGAASSRACPRAVEPVCLTAGASAGRCVECASYTQCGGSKPVCTGGNVCETCNADFGAAGTKPCPTTTQPFCTSGGTCAKCTSNADCTGRSGGICNLTTGACGTVCAVDRDCKTTEWCQSGTCTPKTPNDQPLPSAAPIAGECTPQNGLRVCISASCFDADDKCGLPNSESCGPPTNDAVCRSGVCFQRDAKCGLPKGEACTSATVCRSAICAADGRCGECKADKDCGGPQSARVCDEKTSLCVDGCRGRDGNGCGTGLVCSSTSDLIGKCGEPVKDAGAPDAADASKPTVDASKPAVDASAPVEAAPTTEGESQGCACDAAGASGSGTGAMAVLGLFGTFAIAARRRVRRESRSEKESV